ncbi:MAG: hypothetical protein LBD22_07200 [Spirochaetaceae bacterium]|jgi:hypothetical protein|nr:hypothetical protein [Spirochaetaceae bacterium]
MKKVISITVSVFVAAGILVGCASAIGKGTASHAPKSIKKSMPNAPEFVLNPPQDDEVIYGVGSANLSTVNMSMTMAETRARTAIARELSATARQMIDDYMGDASEISGSKRDAEAFAQIVSRTLAEAKMSGARVVRRDVSQDGTWWCLVSYNKNTAAKDALSVINKEKVNYAAYKNWNAQRDMEAAFAAQKNTDMEYVKE